MISILELNPHTVREIQESLTVEKKNARWLYNKFRNVCYNFRKTHGANRELEKNYTDSVLKVPEFQEAINAINRYKLLLEKRENVQKELFGIDAEIERMRPVVEGFEILKRKIREMKNMCEDFKLVLAVPP